MAYETYEESVASGQPIELYRFVSGLQKWLYCTGLAEITYNSELYSPEMLQRSEIRQSDNAFDKELAITVSRNNNLIQQFIPGPLEEKTTLTIYRFHKDDSEFEMIWSGAIAAVTIDDRTATIRCTPITSSLKRIGLRRKYQVQCSHPLYSQGCGVNKESYKVTSTVASVNGLTVTSAIFATKSDGWFVGGDFVSGNARRLITAHSGSTITLVSTIIGLSASDSFTAYAGCKHDTTDCDTKFGNKLNYGGQPYIPVKNPFIGDSIL